jgi:hypothetical protein
MIRYKIYATFLLILIAMTALSCSHGRKLAKDRPEPPQMDVPAQQNNVNEGANGASGTGTKGQDPKSRDPQNIDIKRNRVIIKPVK